MPITYTSILIFSNLILPIQNIELDAFLNTSGRGNNLMGFENKIKIYKPFIHIRYGFHRWRETVNVVGQVALITHELFLWILFSTAFVATTFLTFALGIVLASCAVWCILTYEDEILP